MRVGLSSSIGRQACALVSLRVLGDNNERFRTMKWHGGPKAPPLRWRALSPLSSLGVLFVQRRYQDWQGRCLGWLSCRVVRDISLDIP